MSNWTHPVCSRCWRAFGVGYAIAEQKHTALRISSSTLSRCGCLSLTRESARFASIRRVPAYSCLTGLLSEMSLSVQLIDPSNEFRVDAHQPHLMKLLQELAYEIVPREVLCKPTWLPTACSAGGYP